MSMNYLAHYVIDCIPNAPCYNAGLLLPDLLRPALDGMRIEKLIRRHPSSLASSLLGFHQGIEQHVERDRRFHNSRLFHEESRAIRHILSEEAALSHKRYLFFLAHIWLELGIDRWIITYQPHYAEALYQDWARISYFSWGRLLAYHQLHAHGERIAQRLRRFYEHAFLWKYRDSGQLQGILQRVAQHVGLSYFEDMESERFEAINARIDARIDQRLSLDSHKTLNRGVLQ